MESCACTANHRQGAPEAMTPSPAPEGGSSGPGIRPATVAPAAVAPVQECRNKRRHPNGSRDRNKVHYQPHARGRREEEGKGFPVLVQQDKRIVIAIPCVDPGQAQQAGPERDIPHQVPPHPDQQFLHFAAFFPLADLAFSLSGWFRLYRSQRALTTFLPAALINPAISR